MLHLYGGGGTGADDISVTNYKAYEEDFITFNNVSLNGGSEWYGKYVP